MNHGNKHYCISDTIVTKNWSLTISHIYCHKEDSGSPVYAMCNLWRIVDFKFKVKIEK